MHIVVCIKQVPSTTKVKLDPTTNTMIREGHENVINPFDTYALEEGIRLKKKLGGKVTVLSMGILSTSEILREALAHGADEAILLSDRKFAGADTLATAYTLAEAIRKLADVQLVICGKQATDGDTAQVGPSLAEQLDIPHTTAVSRVERVDKRILECCKLIDEGYEHVALQLPALITVVKEINVPGFFSIAGFRMARDKEIQVWKAQDLGADETRLGLKGSPTQVKKTYVPIHDVQTEFIRGSVSEQAHDLAKRLKAVRF